MYIVKKKVYSLPKLYLDGMQRLEIKSITSFSKEMKLIFLVCKKRNMEAETKKDYGSKRQLIFWIVKLPGLVNHEITQKECKKES